MHKIVPMISEAIPYPNLYSKTHFWVFKLPSYLHHLKRAITTTHFLQWKYLRSCGCHFQRLWCLCHLWTVLRIFLDFICALFYLYCIVFEVAKGTLRVKKRGFRNEFYGSVLAPSNSINMQTSWTWILRNSEFPRIRNLTTRSFSAIKSKERICVCRELRFCTLIVHWSRHFCSLYDMAKIPLLGEEMVKR